MSTPISPTIASDDLSPTWCPQQARRVAVTQGFWAFVDQGVVSLANFVCSVLIARAAGTTEEIRKFEFGLYGMGFLVFVFLTGLAKALVWTPHTSLAPRFEGEDRNRYDASVTIHFLVFTLVSGLAMLLVGGYYTLFVPQSAFARLFFVCSACMGMLLLREHVRRLCLARLHMVEAVVFDLTVSLLQIAGLGLLYLTGKLTGTSALWPMALACALSIGWLWLRNDRFVWNASSVWPHWIQNWTTAKWITPNAIMIQIGNQTPRWFLEKLVGLGGMGTFFPAQNVIQMANPLLLGNANHFGPSSAKVYTERGAAGLWKYTVRNTQFVCGLIGFVVLAAYLFGPDFISLIYGPAYRPERELIVSLAMGMLSEVLLMPVDFSVLTLGKANMSFAANTTRLLVNLSLGLLLVFMLGAVGIGYGLFIGNSVALAWLWTAFAYEVKHHPEEQHLRRMT